MFVFYSFQRHNVSLNLFNVRDSWCTDDLLSVRESPLSLPIHASVARVSPMTALVVTLALLIV